VERERKKDIVRGGERKTKMGGGERERERESKGGDLGREREGDTMGHRGGLYVRGKERRGVEKKRGQA
jgi:hypothetical protein